MSIKWVTIPEYQRMTNLGRPNINKLIEDGDLVTTRTEGGQVRIKIEEHEELEELRFLLEEQKRLLKSLCTHLGVNR